MRIEAISLRLASSFKLIQLSHRAILSICDIQRVNRGQTDRGYKKPVTNTDIEIAIPLGMKRIPDSENQYSFRYETDTG